MRGPQPSFPVCPYLIWNTASSSWRGKGNNDSTTEFMLIICERLLSVRNVEAGVIEGLLSGSGDNRGDSQSAMFMCVILLFRIIYYTTASFNPQALCHHGFLWHAMPGRFSG